MPHSTRAIVLATINFLSVVVAKAVPWVLAIVLMRTVAESATVLSGTDNAPKAWFELLGNIKVTRTLAFIFGAVGFLFGIEQRRLRLQEQAQASARISELEHEPGRSGG